MNTFNPWCLKLHTQCNADPLDIPAFEALVAPSIVRPAFPLCVALQMYDLYPLRSVGIVKSIHNTHY